MQIVIKSTLLVAAALFLSFGVAFADDDKALPAESVISAIQAAVAAQPGLVKEVEVERERGRLVVEVEIVTDGRKTKVKIDPETHERIR